MLILIFNSKKYYQHLFYNMKMVNSLFLLQYAINIEICLNIQKPFLLLAWNSILILKYYSHTIKKCVKKKILNRIQVHALIMQDMLKCV